ncbi:MAG: PASTA domain-containing protein, partial [Clostridia bacterium]|nr:PASTA domain-containing protein [Clostridia bacterium]
WDFFITARGAARGRGRRRARWAVLAVMLAVLAAAAGYGVSRWLAVPEVPVPSVQNLPLDKAQQKLKQAGLSWIIGPAQYSSTVPSTYVASQDPPPGTVVKATHPVTLYLSKGPEYVEGGVPDLKGRPQRDAEIALKNARLQYTVSTEHDDTVPKGYVISTNPPAGDSIRVGDTVELIVSDGPAPRPITMPDLRGMTLGQAQALLEQLGLVVSSTQTKKSSYPEDIVADQTPAPNAQVQAGDPVTLTVSSGCEHSAPVSVTPDPQRYDQPVGVRAVVTDSTGDHIDFQDTVQPGESVPIQACWAGASATLNVYFNDQLVERVELH